MLSPTERHAIVAECQAIVTAFSVHADLGELEQCAALFTEDGQFERRGEMLTGRPAILAALRARPPLLHARHHCLPPHVTIRDADSADGITYFTIYRHEGALAAGTPAPLTGPASIGEFHDRFVRTPEGWRLRLRTTQVAFRR
ncbi:MAG: nuclear transport factor 2 family protein [Rhodoferax sp.]|nr:nuclear transport factor 2 family protein [Rhodoferax sp.]MCW5630094.1 nuclear transport factor 2 family protein [Rhodoferax sp.]